MSSKLTYISVNCILGIATDNEYHQAHNLAYLLILTCFHFILYCFIAYFFLGQSFPLSLVRVFSLLLSYQPLGLLLYKFILLISFQLSCRYIYSPFQFNFLDSCQYCLEPEIVPEYSIPDSSLFLFLYPCFSISLRLSYLACYKMLHLLKPYFLLGIFLTSEDRG